MAAGHPHPQHSLRCHDGGVRDLVHGRAARVGEGIFREDHKAVRASVRGVWLNKMIDCWRLRSLLRSLSTPKWSNTSSFCSLCQDWPSSTYCISKLTQYRFTPHLPVQHHLQPSVRIYSTIEPPSSSASFSSSCPSSLELCTVSSPQGPRVSSQPMIDPPDHSFQL